MPEISNQEALTELLDAQADTQGLKSVDDTHEDWTDVKHSERKKRDRILDDGVLIGLMVKSDYQGFKRLTINLSILAGTAYSIYRLNPDLSDIRRLLILLPLYLFYGFQFQCFAFAGQHEFLHRNAFKTKLYNDIALFLTGVVCFELGEHERVMHKQHHTYTNNIDKDPELTSYYSRETLEDPAFRNLPATRFAYFRGFLDVVYTFKCRAGRILCSAAGVPVDYSGFGWSLKDWTYSNESGIMKKLQRTALLQLFIYATVFGVASQVQGGFQSLVFWWLAPVICGYPCVNYFRNLEHANCEVSKDPNCLLNTRSVRSNLFIRTLLWDTNFVS